MYVEVIAFMYLVLSKTIIHEVLPHVIILDSGIYPIEKGSVGIQFYVDIENVNHRKICSVQSRPRMCCVEADQYKDCSRDVINGDNIETVLPKRRETLVSVYPTLIPYDQVGFCELVIDYQCGPNKRSTQLDVNIPFNTQLIENNEWPIYLKRYKKQRRYECASSDEDVLNNCAQVNCDLKYSGRRPFYDEARRKCVSAPACATNIRNGLPDVVYLPGSNICRNLEQPLTLTDIYILSGGLAAIAETPKKGNEIKVELKSNCSTISQNLSLLKDLMTGKLCPVLKVDTSDYTKCFAHAVSSIFLCILATVALILSIFCCIHTTICLYNNGSKGKIKDYLQMLKAKLCQKKTPEAEEEEPTAVSKDLKNTLLKEVIISDLPLELRDSIVNICDRINKEVEKKKRYRMMDIGSQINLIEVSSESDFESSSARARHDFDD